MRSARRRYEVRRVPAGVAKRGAFRFSTREAAGKARKARARRACARAYEMRRRCVCGGVRCYPRARRAPRRARRATATKKESAEAGERRRSAISVRDAARRVRHV